MHLMTPILHSACHAARATRPCTMLPQVVPLIASTSLLSSEFMATVFECEETWVGWEQRHCVCLSVSVCVVSWHWRLVPTHAPLCVRARVCVCSGISLTSKNRSSKTAADIARETNNTECGIFLTLKSTICTHTHAHAREHMHFSHRNLNPLCTPCMRSFYSGITQSHSIAQWPF